jgi:Ca-activated chloride channel family protein
MTNEQLAKLAVQYNLATEYTHYLIVHERAEGEKADDLPEIRQVKQMLAAGWGGSGVVRTQPCMAVLYAEDLSLDFCDNEGGVLPNVMTSRRARTIQPMGQLGAPTPRKKRGSKKMAITHGSPHLIGLLNNLIEIVNRELIHPDDFPDIVRRIEQIPELNQLHDFIRDIDKQGMRTNEVWVAFISWATQQVGSECQLTRHAARSIHSLSGAVAPDRLAGLMVQFNEKISRRESLSNALGTASDQVSGQS